MRFAFSILLLAACACTRVHPLDPTPGTAERDGFNRRADGERVTVTRAGGEAFRPFATRLEGTSLVWSDSAGERPGTLPLASIAELRFRDSGPGALDGLLIGSGVGLAMGGFLFAAMEGVCQGRSCSVGSRLKLFVYAVPPALLGTLVGAFVGASRRYVVGPGESSGAPRDAQRR